MPVHCVPVHCVPVHCVPVHCVCMWHVACGVRACARARHVQVHMQAHVHVRCTHTACTLQVRTQHRFELTLSEPLLIGMRRAAQRMLGAAQKRVAAGEKPDDVTPMLAEELAKISQA